MAESNGSSSPDPIVLPTSPIISPASRFSRIRPLAQKSPNRFASPSKSIVIDTPKRHGLSPWRIKVTVEPQPEETRPGRRVTRSTSIPVAEISGLVSPAKRAGTESLEEEVVRRTPRRRRDMHSARGATDRDGLSDMEKSVVFVHTAPEPSVSPLRQPPRRRSRMNPLPNTSHRSKRLSVAREELDEALRSAIGSSVSRAGSEIPGDVTVSANEDFSMVSMESLLSTKNTNISQGLSAIPEQNNSVGTISYVPSSPPKIQYPDISGPAREAQASLGRSDYDAMSWKPTGRAQVVEYPETTPHISDDSVHREEEREPASVRDFSPPRNETVEHTAQQPRSEDVGFDDDIWQEEASRSVGEEDNQEVTQASVAARDRQPQNFDDLFADQPSKPPRAKIPRTWRRTSGHDFSYSDSPAHTVDPPRKQSGNSTEGSGVLTPPSSDEENPEHPTHDQAEGQMPDDHTELTQPDAVGTQFVEHADVHDEENVRSDAYVQDPGSPLSDSDSSASSPDGEDTGLFWQNNLPNIYRNRRTYTRPQRQDTVDLSDLLRSHSTTDEEESQHRVSEPRTSTDKHGEHDEKPSERATRPELPRLRPITGEFHLKPSDSDGKVLCSPLRRSLLKSSKVTTGAPVVGGVGIHRVSGATTENQNSVTAQALSAKDREYVTHGRRNGSMYVNGRYQSRYSRRRDQPDQVKVPDSDLKHNSPAKFTRKPVSPVQEDHGDTVEKTDMSRSYEERLNLDSPLKIRVNFDDSTKDSSFLVPATPLPPIFGKPSAHRDDRPTLERTRSPPYVTLVAPKTASSTQGILSRLSTNFWSAVIRPSGPTEVLPEPIAPVSHAQETENLFPSALRTQLRGRYGVVSECFPWTMAHIRTLHRMLNSHESARPDTLIPSPPPPSSSSSHSTSSAPPPPPPLPSCLAAMADTTRTSVTGHRFRFTRAHAYVVFAFAQVLAPQHVILAMRTGEVEWLGDAQARRCRGFLGERHGDEAVWKLETHRPDIVRWVDGLAGPIFLEFVVRALGDVLWSNEQLAAKEGVTS